MTKKKIGILGSGQVGQVLAAGFLHHGYEVMIGTRDVTKLADWLAKNNLGKVGSFEAAATYGEIIVLAVKGTSAEELVKSLSGSLSGKIIIDTTNPIAEAPPENGLLKFFTTLEDSLMERLQKSAPDAFFVKAFNSVGNSLMVNPVLPAGKPTMFVCGNSDDAKKAVTGILEQFEWEVEDMGKVESARAIEPLCILWCIPGFLRNQWNHAFKLVRP